MRKIAVITVARSDFGIYLPLLRKLDQDPKIELRIIAGGMHLSEKYGKTIDDIREQGFTIAAEVEFLLDSDSPCSIAESMGKGTMEFAKTYARCQPDMIVVLGDRFEMHAATVAATPFMIPVAHLYGGELTEGAIDDSFRHSITKLSHLHFASTDRYARRIIQLGEAPWRVTVSGALSLDNIDDITFLTREELESKFNIILKEDPLLITYHPVTLECEGTAEQMENLLSAIEKSNLPAVFSMPNADTGNALIIRMIEDFVVAHSNVWLVPNFGTQAYFSMMKYAVAMVGNSSSGIMEATSFKLPVVNIGNRQKGRIRANNVIDVGYGEEEIFEGIKKAVSDDFQSSIVNIINPYRQGNAAQIICDSLKKVSLDQRLITKGFYDFK